MSTDPIIVHVEGGGCTLVQPLGYGLVTVDHLCISQITE